MPAADQAVLVQHIRRLAGGPPGSEVSDRELLRHYTARRDEAAFAALVRRHGPMVLGVCRRVLRQRARTPRTPSRPPSSSSPARPARSAGGDSVGRLAVRRRRPPGAQGQRRARAARRLVPVARGWDSRRARSTTVRARIAGRPRRGVGARCRRITGPRCCCAISKADPGGGGPAAGLLAEHGAAATRSSAAACCTAGWPGRGLSLSALLGGWLLARSASASVPPALAVGRAPTAAAPGAGRRNPPQFSRAHGSPGGHLRPPGGAHCRRRRTCRPQARAGRSATGADAAALASNDEKRPPATNPAAPDDPLPAGVMARDGMASSAKAASSPPSPTPATAS